MSNHEHRSNAFTLVEMMVALVILGIAITLALGGWIQMLVGETRVNAQCQLDMDARDSMERLRADMRVSALNNILFWPAGVGPYTGISFPKTVAASATNLLDNGGTNIVWTQTVIYHVYQTTPNQLLRTVFYNRDPNASVSNRQNQLNLVVTNGSGQGACINAETYTTSLLFQNLFNWQITPNTAQFDCYAATTMRDRFLFGSAAIGSGAHNVQFTVIGKNPQGNANRYLGIDLLNCSVSGSDQEAEDQPYAAIGPTSTLAKTYMPNGSWSGNYQLQANCTTNGQGVAVTVQNDCWTESNFQTYGGSASNTYCNFDTTLTPYYHYVMQLVGATGLVWKAGGSGATQDPQSQCYDSSPDNNSSTPVALNACYRIPVNGAYILQNGYGPILIFQKCNVNPVLTSPTIAIANNAGSTNFTCDAAPGSVQPLYFFQGGKVLNWASCTNGYVYALPATPFNVYPNQSCLVSYYTQNVGGPYNMYHCEDQRSNFGSYVLTNSPSSCTTNECWSTNSRLTTDNQIEPDSVGRIFALYQLASCYAPTGAYTSAIFDSGQSVPTAKTVSWSVLVPTNASCTLVARTGNQPDMSDATAWTNLTPLVTSTNNSFPNNTGRYIQFQANMGMNLLLYPPCPMTPRLQSVSFLWPGDTKMLDVAGILTRGTDYAQCQVTVDGQPLTRSIKVDLTIYKNVRRISGGSNEQFTSFITEEVQPRNTGL